MDQLPVVSSAEAVAEAMLRLRSLVLRLEKEEISTVDLKSNLQYAAGVLESLKDDQSRYIDVFSFLLDFLNPFDVLQKKKKIIIVWMIVLVLVPCKYHYTVFFMWHLDTADNIYRAVHFTQYQ